MRTEFQDADLRANTLSKQVAQLTAQLGEGENAVKEETRQKLALQSKLRSLEDEREQLREAIEDLEDSKLNSDKTILTVQQQVNELTKKLDESNNAVAGMEKHKDKLAKELDQTRLQLEEQVAATSKADKSR